MEIHRSYFYYESVKDDTEVEEAIRAAAEYGDGFEKIFQRLRHDGYTWNHKMPAERVISIMEKVIFINGKPVCIRDGQRPGVHL